MTTTTDGQLNEVDLSAVGALVEAIKQDPSAAQTTWSAEVRWTGAFRSVAAVRGHPPFAFAAPARVRALSPAATPVQPRRRRLPPPRRGRGCPDPRRAHRP